MGCSQRVVSERVVIRWVVSARVALWRRGSLELVVAFEKEWLVRGCLVGC